MHKYDFKFDEITFLRGYCSVNIVTTDLQQNAFFREHIGGTASLYRSKYRYYKCRVSF